MPKIDRRTIEQLRELLPVYEQEINESNYVPNWQRQMVGESSKAPTESEKATPESPRCSGLLAPEEYPSTT